MLDISVLLYVTYSFSRLLFTKYTVITNDQFITLVLLAMLYFIIKHVIKDELILKCLISVFVIAGLFQGVFGLLQLYGYIPSNNRYFKITGSFGNPDALAGYIVSVIPFAFGMFNICKNDKNFDKYFKNIGLAAFLVLSLGLAASRIRGGWLAALIGCGFIYYNKYKNEILNYTKRKFILVSSLIVGFMALGVLIIFLFSLKPDSANGRFLIWKISTGIIEENPIFGIGFDRFATEYNNYQADYFVSGKGNDYEKIIASNVNRGHNEYIEIFAELGIIGVFLFFIILYKVFKSPNVLVNPNIENKFIVLSKASLIAICVFSFTSFPFHILPTYINFFFLLALVSTHQKSIYNINLSEKYYKTAIVPVIILAIVIASNSFKQYKSYQSWNEGVYLSYTGNYFASERIFSEIYRYLKNNGEFILNYGGTLSLAGKHKEAIELLEEAKNKFTDPTLCSTLGNSYLSVGNYARAEANYLHAVNMIPHKFYPKYLLVKYYDRMGKGGKALLLAKELLEMKEKVPSQAVEEIKREMKYFISKDKY